MLILNDAEAACVPKSDVLSSGRQGSVRYSQLSSEVCWRSCTNKTKTSLLKTPQAEGAPVWPCSNAPNSQCALADILSEAEVHAVHASCHEVVSITQLLHNAGSALHVHISEAHALHVLMQARDNQGVISKVLHGAEQSVLLGGRLLGKPLYRQKAGEPHAAQCVP